MLPTSKRLSSYMLPTSQRLSSYMLPTSQRLSQYARYFSTTFTHVSSLFWNFWKMFRQLCYFLKKENTHIYSLYFTLSPTHASYFSKAHPHLLNIPQKLSSTCQYSSKMFTHAWNKLPMSQRLSSAYTQFLKKLLPTYVPYLVQEHSFELWCCAKITNLKFSSLDF